MYTFCLIIVLFYFFTYVVVIFSQNILITRFQPAQGGAGARSPWGGEVGGVGVDGKGNPGLILSTAVQDLRQSKARIVLESSPPLQGITSHWDHQDSNSSSSVSNPNAFPKL